MPRNQLLKVVFVLVLIVGSIFSLYPTFQLGGMQKNEASLVSQIMKLTGLTKTDIEVGLTEGTLESKVRNHVSKDSLDDALQVAGNLIKLNTKIIKVEGKAIRRGLDLQGGTYLVYEVDVPQLLNDLAKNKDERLTDIIKATQKQTDKSGNDFLDVLQENFRNRNVRLNRYFGRKGETDDDIIKELQKASEDAIDRTIAILRNRVDQFGVSEPSITKQGTRRIVIELAGIQNIQRAKKIIGTTALLEFKLVRDSEMVWSILNDIDRVMRLKRRGQQPAKEDTTKVAKADTTQFKEGKKAENKTVSLSDLFGGDTTQTKAGKDTSLLVDQNTFNEKPFTSLLRQVTGKYSNVISVPVQNVAAVKRILQLPKVRQVIPNDSEFLWRIKPVVVGENSYQQLYLVKKEPELLGSTLTDAKVQISGGAQSLNAGAAVVNFQLNSEGTKTFAKVTGMNVGKQLAIVLDHRIAMAPNIKGKIPSGSGQIEGMSSIDEAKDLALVLRAGALPAPVYAITENTVGPSLGHDSIQKGQKSAIIGLLLVVFFMILYYRVSGIIADFALLLNIIFILAFMAGFHATLTLPGIAGIILTVGMAVDANVLIFERIREELRTGKTIRASIDSGYGRAFKTILDANVTTLITAVVLYSFGTGPIKGFALTLSIGIIASMFTAIFVTRLIFNMITSRVALKKLSI
ncbi:MAG: protein translocase subunit SecD [Actinobacteria bacterium]|nr:protein translocase subunit SecD [Actinomycetota bacterium]